MSDFSFLGPILQGAAAVAPVVASVIGTNAQTSAAKDAAQQSNAGLQRGADIISTGYDQAHDAQTGAIGNVAADQAKNFDLVAPMIAAIPPAYTGALNTGALNYGTNLLTGVGNAVNDWYGPGAADYTKTLGTGAGDFAGKVAGNASSYSGDIGKGADSYGGDVTGAASSYAGGMKDLAGDIYNPYAASGRTALSVLQGIVGSNPADMTPAQQIARDNYIRQAQESLAASGMRGSGRAVTASLDTGLANLDAQDTAQNQARVDNATRSLLSAGELGAGQQYNAGSAGAGAQLTADQQAALQRLSAINTGAQARLNAGTAGAQAELNATDAGAANQNQVTQKAGDLALGATNTGAGALYNAGNKGADMAVTGANNLISATNNYLTQKAGTDFAQGQVDTSDIMGKAATQGAAAQGTGATNAAVTAANGANWGGAIGTLGGVIAASNKALGFPTPSSSLTPLQTATIQNQATSDVASNPIF